MTTIPDRTARWGSPEVAAAGIQGPARHQRRHTMSQTIPAPRRYDTPPPQLPPRDTSEPASAQNALLSVARMEQDSKRHTSWRRPTPPSATHTTDTAEDSQSIANTERRRKRKTPRSQSPTHTRAETKERGREKKEPYAVKGENYSLSKPSVKLIFPLIFSIKRLARFSIKAS